MGPRVILRVSVSACLPKPRRRRVNPGRYSWNLKSQAVAESRGKSRNMIHRLVRLWRIHEITRILFCFYNLRTPHNLRTIAVCSLVLPRAESALEGAGLPRHSPQGEAGCEKWFLSLADLCGSIQHEKGKSTQPQRADQVRKQISQSFEITRYSKWR